MRTCIYTRISQDSTGEALGVTRQLEDCLALADRLGWEVVAQYDDNDLSAFSGKTRPGFEEMLVAMANGQIDALLCWHPDRLYRSMKDLERVIDIADAKAISIRTVNGGDLDLSHSSGRMMARILGSVARQESEHKGERQKRANIQHRESGKWSSSGARPFGYTRQGEPLEPEATLVRQAAKDVLGGKSLRSVSVDWTKDGILTTRGGKWTNLGIRRVLMNPLYAALVTYDGKIVGPGQWTPLIDEDTHRGLAAFLSDRTRKSSVAFVRQHQGSGVYICSTCGEKLYASFPSGRAKNRLVYICRAGGHVARVGAPVDELVDTIVVGYLLENGVAAGLRSSGVQVDVAELRTKRAGLQARLEELSGMFAAGDIDGAQLRRGSVDLRKSLADIDAVLAEAARTSPLASMLGDDLTEDLDEEAVVDRWKSASADIRGKVIGELMDVVVHKATQGARTFDPDLIEIRWR